MNPSMVGAVGGDDAVFVGIKVEFDEDFLEEGLGVHQRLLWAVVCAR